MNELKILAKSFEEFKQDSLDKMEDCEEGEDGSHSVSFEDPTKLRKVLTEKRIELIQFLISNDVESTSELAEKLGRGVKEVGEDIQLLEEYGTVKLEKEGRTKRPSVPYDQIQIEICIRSKNQNQKIKDKSPA